MDSFIDVEKLAQVVASKEWPVASVAEVLERFFSKESAWFADHADTAAWKQILAAAKAERPREIPAMMDAICALMDWSDVEKGRDNVRVTYVLRDLARYSYNNSAVRSVPPSLWISCNPLDIACMVRLLDLPLVERGAWAAKIVRALEWGEESAMEAVGARISGIKPDARGYLVWDSTDDIEARAFDLMTAGLDEEARVLWPINGGLYASSAARACVSYFTRKTGAPRPTLTLKNQREHFELDWAEYAVLLKTSFPALFDDAFLKLLEKLSVHPRVLRSMTEGVADESSVDGGKTTWRVGPLVVTHSGNPERGRWSWKQAAPAKPKKKATKK